jgi:hypothetical protein
MKKIYISDLDGTLLKNDAIISNYTSMMLKFLIKKDIQFTVASARSIESIQKILKGIPIKLPIIDFNGSFISDLKTGKHFIINEINREITFDILEIIQALGKILYVSSFNGEKDYLYYSQISNQGMGWYLENRIKSKVERLKQVEKLENILSDNIICFTVIDKKEKMTKLVEVKKKRYSGQVALNLIENQYSPIWFWFTIHNNKATKDQAIKLLLDYLNISIENLTVFGDNLKDMKIFKIAPRSIAV